MRFEHAYRRGSSVADQGDRTAMSFSPDLTRAPTFFRGELAQPLAFREAMSALHDVVVADLRWKPKDKTAYLAWAAQHDVIDWPAVDKRRAALHQEIGTIETELRALMRRRDSRWNGFNRAKRAYFDYLYNRDRDAWIVLDPVITVHPDQIFFECFSQDESSYGRLACSYEVFRQLGDRANGTTNVDYSQGLYDEFQKIRSYKTTALEIDPSGFGVETSMEPAYKEVKIDLPDSWVRGFLQVSAAMTLPAVTFDLHPMDLHNLCFVLRRKRELVGPRSLRWRLSPGKPVRVAFDPWGFEQACPRSIYAGDREVEIRVWGRRRLHLLERLVPIAKKFRVHLLGGGMPSFIVADLGDLSFTLGLSGWTANDWADSGNFDLLAAREDVDELTRRRVLEALRAVWVDDLGALSSRLGLDRSVVASALGGWVQAGRAIYDLDRGVYRLRELSREPLPVEQLRYASPREEEAARLFHAGPLAVDVRELAGGAVELVGSIKDRGKAHPATLTMDGDRRIVDASCTCNFFQQHRLRKGPCAHLLVLRLAHQRGLARIVIASAEATAEAAKAAAAAPATAKTAPAAKPSSASATPAAPSSPA
ncbi:MAG: SWIM zinc finger family protein, partial [Deltaproteobacteria bacterium]|nr:SWIM zinc finger family protein [Deltaproteobacteria bacterium]